MVNETYRYLGYGVTNENGVAKLDHDANGDAIEHSYTGVGAGEIDVVASLDNPVVDGSIVSETFSIMDTDFYDKGTTQNTKWYVQNANCQLGFGDTGITITEQTNGACTVAPLSVAGSTQWNDFVTVPVDFAVEFEVSSATTGIIARIMNTSFTNITQRDIGTTTGHYKYEIKSDGIYLTIDNGSPITISSSSLTGSFIFAFVTSNDSNTGSVTFNDFKIYPI